MKNFSIIIGVFLAVFWAAPACGGDISISAQVQPEVVNIGGRIDLTITINGKFRKTGKLILPDMKGFNSYSSGSSQSFNMMNGALSASITYNYILVATEPGRFEIAPIKYRLGDKEYLAPPVVVQVAGRAQSAKRSPARPESRAAQKASRGKRIFVSAYVERDTVYVNQQITWVLNFFMDSNARMVQSPSFSPPEAAGFGVEDLPPQQNFTKTLQGRRYAVSELKRAYFPTASGRYTIGPAVVTAALDDFGPSNWDDIFNKPFGGFGFGKPVTVATDSIKVVVLPLPERGRPAGFSGAVARQLSLSIRADKHDVQVGEPVNVTVELEGEGNIETIAAPALTDIPGFKIYQSSSSSKTTKQGYKVSGSKKYEYILIPKIPGSHQIDALRLPYFDPVDKVYEDAGTGKVLFTVNPGTKEGERKVIIAGSGKEIEVLAKDINYIHPAPEHLNVSGSPFRAGKLYAALHMVPALAVVFLFSLERKRKKAGKDLPAARAAGAGRNAEKKLSGGKKLVAGNNVEGAVVLASDALNGYAADKMNTSQAGLTCEAFASFLRTRSVAEQDIEKYCSVINECDAARYAGAACDGNRALELISKAGSVINALEKGYLG